MVKRIEEVEKAVIRFADSEGVIIPSTIKKFLATNGRHLLGVVFKYNYVVDKLTLEPVIDNYEKVNKKKKRTER